MVKDLPHNFTDVISEKSDTRDSQSKPFAAKVDQFETKSNLYYSREITPKHVTSGGVHLRNLASDQYTFEETYQPVP